MKKVLRLTESGLVELVNKVINEQITAYERLRDKIDLNPSGGQSDTIVIKSSSPMSFYKDVKNGTAGLRIDLNSITITMSDTGESVLNFKISPTSEPVIIIIPFSEETDGGSCPSCEKVRKSNPNAKVVKIKGLDYGTFGKNRKFQVFAIPHKERTSDVKRIEKATKKYSSQAINEIKNSEDFRSQIYDDKCPNAPYPSVTNPKRCGGTLTVGYGSTIPRFPELKKYVKGSKNHMTKQEGEQYIIKFFDENCVPIISETIKIPLNQNQYDALTLFVYNVNEIGDNLAKAINSRNKKEIKNWWEKYVYSGGKYMPGLLNRRRKELDMFFKK